MIEQIQFIVYFDIDLIVSIAVMIRINYVKIFIEVMRVYYILTHEASLDTLVETSLKN